MKAPTTPLALTLAASVLASAAIHADEDINSVITDGEVSIDLRYRFEGVEQDGFDEDAKASLLRLRVTLTSAPLNGFLGSIEIDNVTAIGPDDYNSTENGKTEYPTIADPEYTEFNQAWLAYRSEIVTATLGRQRITHLNRRIIGSKPWRNNELTYDGVRLEWKATPGLSLDLSYVNNVNQIFGPDDGTRPANLEGDYVFALGEYQLGAEHTLNAFAYLFDVDPQAGFSPGQTVNQASDSYGMQYRGKFDALSLRASYAVQSDAGRSELNYSTDYLVVEASGDVGPLQLRAMYEVLGSDNGVSFATPFANGHGVQGWADMFLSTPSDGIRDANLSVGGSVGPVNLRAIYHDFSADASSTDFGTEIDLLAVWPVSKKVRLEAKYADFSTDSPDRYPDTRKIWFTAQFTLP